MEVNIIENIHIKEGCTLDYNKPVHIYKNLHNDKLSIRQKSKVVAYADYIYLTNVTFHIQKAGQEKARREKQRNVHAYAKGFITDKESVAGLRITYNPFKHDTFVNENGDPIHSVRKLVIYSDGYMLGSTNEKGEIV